MTPSETAVRPLPADTYLLLFHNKRLWNNKYLCVWVRDRGGQQEVRGGEALISWCWHLQALSNQGLIWEENRNNRCYERDERELSLPPPRRFMFSSAFICLFVNSFKNHALRKGRWNQQRPMMIWYSLIIRRNTWVHATRIHLGVESCHAWCLVWWPKDSISVSSEQRILFPMVSVSFKWTFHNSWDHCVPALINDYICLTTPLWSTDNYLDIDAWFPS